MQKHNDLFYPDHKNKPSGRNPSGWFGLIFLILLIPVMTPAENNMEEDTFAEQRARMVSRQIENRGVTNAEVLAAMRKVPRHLFVPERYRKYAYADHPLPIGEGQTISQPYIVGYMTDVLRLKPGDRILEVGTGSGYQAAVLAELGCKVYSIEIIDALAQRARKTLRELEYRNVYIKTGDGYQGWAEEAPFDAVIVTCAPEDIPKPLVEQLKQGGRMIIPVGKSDGIQQLVLAVKQDGRLSSRSVMPVRFVPMVGQKD